jgi:hypothetical protein
MVNSSWSSPELTGCTFSQNLAQRYGGAIVNMSDSSPMLTNCSLLGNIAGSGGAIYNSDSSPMLMNCLIVGNDANEYHGGGMYSSGFGVPILTNCTFVGNSASDTGGGIYNIVSTPKLTNCILWGNIDGSGVGASAQLWGDSIINYSCVQGYVEPNEPYEPPTQGFISHWTFDEGEGSIAYDSIGDSNGTLINGPQWTTGQVDGALSFDGVDDYVEVAWDESLANVADNFTILLWAQPLSTHQIDTESSSGTGGTSGQKYAIGPYQGDNYWGSGHAGAGISIGTNGISVYEHAANYMPAVLVWSGSVSGITHVAVVYSDNRARLYINGESKKTGQQSSKTVHIWPQRIGGYPYGYLNGLIDDVRMYDRSLSAEEIRQLYRYQSGLVVNQGNIGADPVFVDSDNGDYRLIPGSPCIDAGDNTAVPADMADLDEDDDYSERTPSDLDGSMRFVDISPPGGVGVVDPCGYYDIVDMGVFEANYMEARMRFTPPVLNLQSRGRWVIAHLVMPEGFIVEDIDADTPFRVEPIGIVSEFVNVFINEDGDVEIEAGFARRDFCGAQIGDGPLDITVSGLLTNGEYFYGTGTINIRNRTFEYLSALASYWLQTGCRPPNWCEGADFNKDSMVDFVDLAIFDGCCIEAVRK